MNATNSNAQFSIPNARIGFSEMNGTKLELVAYKSRRLGNKEDGSPHFVDDRFNLVAFGPRALEWATMPVGSKVNIGGALQTFNGSVQLVAWELEPVQAAPVAAEPEPEPAPVKKASRSRSRKAKVVVAEELPS